MIREDMPIFSGLAALLPQHTGSRMLVSVSTPDRIESLHLDQPGRSNVRWAR